MKKIDIAKSIIKNNGGIIKTVQLNKAGIQNSEIKKMCESGEIERVRHGYYQIAGQVEISEEKMIATFLEEGIVCNLRCFIMAIVIKHLWCGRLLCRETFPDQKLILIILHTNFILCSMTNYH